MLDSIDKRIAGIYKLSIGKYVYIGQSINIKSRVTHHINDLRKRNHSNRFLQSVYDKHKESQLKINIIYKANLNVNKTLLREILTVLEQIFINYYNAKLNLQPAYQSNINTIYNPGINVFNSTLYHPLKGTIKIKNLAKYCKDNNIDSQLIKKVLNGTLDQHKGYFYNELLYKVYVERTKNIYDEEGLEIPLPISDIKLINELTEEITGLNNYYTEDNKPWSNQEWVNDLFLKYVEINYDLNLVQSLIQNHELLKNCDVQGSRVIKEEQNVNIFKDILYVNIQSAYVTAVSKSDYPFGAPTIYRSVKTKELTLKEFLHQYGDELVEGLYTIYISGELSHKQNLVFSKYGLSSDRIGSKVLGGYYDDTEVVESHLGGKFILTSKQIELGIITSDILEVIQKVCSNKEYKDWMNLKVDAAFFYPKSKELSIEEWCKSHSNIHQLGELKSHSDTRSRKWCRISLNEFIGKLVETRLLYKSKRYESSVYDCKQTLLKLIINTFYGDLASPYFSLGQTVLANNITASVRKASWVMANALGCKFIVTDGGIYTPGKVPCFKDGNKSFVKPSISKLFVKDGRYDVSINYTDLIPYSLQDILKEPNAQELLDSLALKHIHKFCNIYGLTFHFKIEHKLSNSGSMAVTNPYGKVDYIIYAYDGGEIIKVRGVQPKEYNRHPKVEFIRALAEGREVKFSGSELIELIGVNQYIRTPNKYGIDLPGEEITVEYIHKPNKKGGYIFETYDDFLKAEHAHKVRISRYEHKYKDVVITLKPRFID